MRSRHVAGRGEAGRVASCYDVRTRSTALPPPEIPPSIQIPSPPPPHGIGPSVHPSRQFPMVGNDAFVMSWSLDGTRREGEKK